MTRVKFKNIIPDHWYNISVTNEETLRFLGTRNLEYLNQYWQREKRALSSRIRRVQSQIDFLDGKTIGDLREIAKQYAYPQEVQEAIRKGEYGWIAEDDTISSETTFNYCGWCKYSGERSLQKDGQVVTACTILPENAYGARRPALFPPTSPCALVGGHGGALNTSLIYLHGELKRLTRHEAEIGKYTEILAEALSSAEEKPFFSAYRPSDWFKIGDDVVIIPGKSKHMMPEKCNQFVAGQVCHCRNNVVSVRTREPVRTDECTYLVTQTFRPEILQTWEYEYLKAHHDFLQIWLQAGAGSFRFEAFSIYRAFGY